MVPEAPKDHRWYGAEVSIDRSIGEVPTGRTGGPVDTWGLSAAGKAVSAGTRGPVREDLNQFESMPIYLTLKNQIGVWDGT